MPDRVADGIEDGLAALAARTAGSKALRAAWCGVLADSRASAGFRAALKELHYPIVGNRADGAHFRDVDGNDYVDIAMGFGVQLFGHNAGFIREAIAAQLGRGLHLGPQARLAGEVASQIKALTGVERLCFCSTGTEAVMTALRLARAATGRETIAMFKWSYHGHFDATLGRPQAGRTVPLAPGVSAGAVERTLMLDYGEAASLAALDAHREELAAVIVEPVQSLNPQLQPREFLLRLSEWTRRHGVALIFDDILTGFRIHPGGTQHYFSVAADLVTYGKIIGGGLPIGVVAGRAKYLDFIDGGAWHYGDDSAPAARRTFFAGTFNKNPLGMAAAHAVLSKLTAEGPGLQAALNARTADLVDELNRWLQGRAIPIEIARFGSMFRFLVPGKLESFFYRLIGAGIYLWEGRSCFLSTAHGDDDIARIAAAVRRAASEL
jgi:glutamate-1-semialdehyde aminotransferase